MTPEKLAQLFHETYERLAPDHGYETREASAKPWSEVPANNRDLMIATCGAVLENMSVMRSIDAWWDFREAVKSACGIEGLCSNEDMLAAIRKSEKAPTPTQGAAKPVPPVPDDWEYLAGVLVRHDDGRTIRLESDGLPGDLDMDEWKPDMSDDHTVMLICRAQPIMIVLGEGETATIDDLVEETRPILRVHAVNRDDPTDENIDAAVESCDFSHAVWLLRERLSRAQAKNEDLVAKLGVAWIRDLSDQHRAKSAGFVNRDDDVLMLTVSQTSEKGVAVAARSLSWSPTAWGIVIVDVARNLARSYSDDTRDQAEYLVEFKHAFEDEWNDPSDWPDQDHGARLDQASTPSTKPVPIPESLEHDAFLAERRDRTVKVLAKRDELLDQCVDPNRSTLRVHAVNRDIVESDEVAAGPGLDTLIVRDDLGRKLDIAAMAWGDGDGLSYGDGNLWPWTGGRPAIRLPIIASKTPLDRAKTYLVIVVEHPDEAIDG